MLPDRERERNKDNKTQASIAGYTETFVPYSDALFRKTAVEWLIATDQVCRQGQKRCP